MHYSLRILETVSSEVACKTSFKGRYTAYIPDFFLIFIYVTVMSISGVLDRLVIVFVFLHELELKRLLFGVILTTLSVAQSILIFFVTADCSRTLCVREWGTNLCFIVLIILGLDSIFIGGKILLSNFIIEESSVNSAPFPFFHLKHIDLSFIKICCFITSVIKSIPQMFAAAILLLISRLNGLVVYLTLGSIFLNMVIFSLTIAITLPIRKSPEIFKTCFCVLLNSFCKFLATMSSCGLNLILFVLFFKNVGYFAFLLHFSRLILSVWPCWLGFKSQPFPKCCLILYAISFAFVFNFIYIHPFQGLGSSFYYIFYFSTFLVEVMCIYVFTDADYDLVTIYFALSDVTELNFGAGAGAATDLASTNFNDDIFI